MWWHIENPQDEKALNVALNKAVGEWEPIALADLLADLQASGYDVGATGFDAAEIDDLFSQVHNQDVEDDGFDTEKAAEAEAFVESGDIWLLGQHRLMCGDSTIPNDVKRSWTVKWPISVLPTRHMAVIIPAVRAWKILNDTLKGREFYEFLLAAMKNIYKHLADGGALYLFHSDAEKVNFYNAVVDAGFHYSTTCVWVKNSLVIGRMDYQMRHEPVLYAFKDTARHKFYGDRKQTTVWGV